MILIRNSFEESGIYGELLNDLGQQIAVTLEHAYKNTFGNYYPKVPESYYNCILGTHQLEGMIHSFQTYELQDVPDHSNILIHMGNYNKDSDGCILLGEERSGDMITNSVKTFDSFISSLNGKQSFMLEIKSDG